jgi:phage shock protein E
MSTPIVALLALAACESHQMSEPPSYPDISVDAAAELVLSDPNVVVLDIRTPEEYAAGHIPGAVLMDCKSAGFADQLRTLDPSKTYVMH